MGHEYSLADIAAANGNGMNNEMWNNPFIYLVWLAVLGGGGLFGNRNGYGDAAVQGAITRSDLFEGNVEGYVKYVAKQLGAEIKVASFVRFEKGEGLEKREDNFADEVASMM